MFCHYHLKELIRIEKEVHYCFAPPQGRMPFIVIERDSPILLSAPHGAITFRNDAKRLWHEEDEYTAGMALLLAEIFQTSVIATTWKTCDSDPNFHHEPRSIYKREIRRIVRACGIRYVIDLHGASDTTEKIPTGKLVDLGIRGDLNSLEPKLTNLLEKRINENLGGDFVNRNGFPAIAIEDLMTITAFSHHKLKIQSVQIEMRPLVRIPERRIDSSAYAKGEQLKSDPELVLSMMHGLGEFLLHLERNG
jgi:hypothetical protein